jgi:hypothetical protein
VNRGILAELIEACEGPGGSGEIPLGAFEVDANNGGDGETWIIMRETDFKRMAEEKLTLVSETKGEARKRLSRVPILFRDDDDAA